MSFRAAKHLFYVVLILYASSNYISAQALVFRETIQNAVLQQGQRYVKFTYNFVNQGHDSITISKVELSCGCSSSEISKDVISPGENGFINVTVDTIGKEGRAYAGIAVETTEKDGLYMLKGYITIPAYITLTPKMLRWQLGEKMTERRFIIKLKAGAGKSKSFHVTNVIVNQEYFDVRVESIESVVDAGRGRYYVVFVRPKKQVKCTDMIKILTDPAGPPEGLNVIAYVSEKRDKL